MYRNRLHFFFFFWSSIICHLSADAKRMNKSASSPRILQEAISMKKKSPKSNIFFVDEIFNAANSYRLQYSIQYHHRIWLFFKNDPLLNRAWKITIKHTTKPKWWARLWTVVKYGLFLALPTSRCGWIKLHLRAHEEIWNLRDTPHFTKILCFLCYVSCHLYLGLNFSVVHS